MTTMPAPSRRRRRLRALYFLHGTVAAVSAVGVAAGPPVMHSIPLQWDFTDGLNGWAQSTAMEMGVEVDAINGYLRGIVLPSAKMAQAFVDSPELRVEIDPDERDHIVLRMKYLGQCDRAVIALERNPDETAVYPGVRAERRVFRDPVQIPFRPRTSSSLEDELYVFPISQYVTGTIHRVRLYPCTKVPSAATEGDAVPWSGQTFHLDWAAFAKAPVVTKVRGCIDKYFSVSSPVAAMNCSEVVRKTNSVHSNSAFACNAMVLPFASTYNCLRGGGQRIAISGKHFGASDAIVTVGGIECTNVVHVVPEVELECTLPPVSTQWLANPTYPSLVKVINGRLHALFDEVPFLSYAAPVAALAAPVLSNVAAHAVDVNWAASTNIWDTMTITGYRIEWKQCTASTFNPKDTVTVGNVTSTTIIQLRSGTGYHARVTALTEDYRARSDWQNIDLYGRRSPLQSAVSGIPSPLTPCVTTLTFDFTFPQFSARLLTNISDTRASITSPTRGPSGEIGDQGHFGLYVNGDANVQNCNATVTCCDGFNSGASDAVSAIAACSLVCSVTESRTATFVNGRTVRTIATNAVTALPKPAKVVQPIATANAGTAIAPVSGPCGPALRLTASASFLTGSAWYPRQMNVREGFDTTFSFRIANPSTVCKAMDDVHTRCRSRGGDGFAFVVQNDNEISVGSGGMELGYGGLKNALSVEFDTWYNHEQLDVYENHVSVHVGRKGEPAYANHTYSLGSTTNLPDLTDGTHVVRILYDPNIDENLLFGEYFSATTLAGNFLSRGDWLSGFGTLSIFIDDLDSPAVAVPLRLDDSIELNHGRAWVGFTASTGATAYQTQDILSWTFESLRRDIARVNAFASVEIS